MNTRKNNDKSTLKFKANIILVYRDDIFIFTRVRSYKHQAGCYGADGEYGTSENVKTIED